MRLANRILIVLTFLPGPGCAKERSIPAPSYLTAFPSDGSESASPSAAAPATPPPQVWPRTYRSATGDAVVMYQPQVDAWKDHSKIRFRAAIAVTPVVTGRTEYGVVAVEADTLVDDVARTVLMTNMGVAVRFPGTSAVQADPLKKLVKDLLPNLNYLDVSLEQVLAHIHKAPALPKVAVNLNPPAIHYSDVPAILVIFMGYQSWGQSYVQRGNQWAQAGHQSSARGSVGYAQSSSGQWAEGARGAGGNTVAKTSSGDYYASHDGNVYKQSDGQWQKYNGNGNWEDTSYKSQAQASAQSAQGSYQSRASSSGASDSWKSDWSSSQWKSDWENRQGGSSDGWGQHDTSSGLNSDSWSRDRGTENAWGGGGGGGGWGGGDRSSGGGGGGWGGGGRSWGGGGRFRR